VHIEKVVYFENINVRLRRFGSLDPTDAGAVWSDERSSRSTAYQLLETSMMPRP
jgi:hypothetical protein